MSIATLIRNADLYAPEHVGHRDILVAGGKIIAVDDRLDPNIPGMETIDAAGLTDIRGLVKKGDTFEVLDANRIVTLTK